MKPITLIDEAACAIDDAKELCTHAIDPELYENMVSNLTSRMLDTFNALSQDKKADPKELIRHMIYHTLEKDGYVQQLTDSIRATMKELDAALNHLADEENERQVQEWWQHLDAIDQRQHASA